MRTETESPMLDSTDPASPDYAPSVLCEGLHCHPNRTMLLPIALGNYPHERIHAGVAPSIPYTQEEDEEEIPVADNAGLYRALRCAWPYFLFLAVATVVIAYHRPWMGWWH